METGQTSNKFGILLVAVHLKMFRICLAKPMLPTLFLLCVDKATEEQIPLIGT